MYRSAMDKATRAIFDAIQKDDLDSLKVHVPSSIRAFMCLDLNGLTTADLLLRQPPLLSIAVFCNALKCAAFLVENGADLDATDNVFCAFPKSISSESGVPL
jgi:hypothetical protein